MEYGGDDVVMHAPTGIGREQDRNSSRRLFSIDGNPMIVLPLERTSQRRGRTTPEHAALRGTNEELLDWSSLRQRRYLAAASNALPLHAGIGTHYVQAYIGSPPQKLALVVDTGSFNMAFPCAGCKRCRSHDADGSFWDPAHSSTSKVVDCDACHGVFT